MMESLSIVCSRGLSILITQKHKFLFMRASTSHDVHSRRRMDIKPGGSDVVVLHICEIYLGRFMLLSKILSPLLQTMFMSTPAVNIVTCTSSHEQEQIKS